MAFKIKRAGVLGAGVMGSTIAAHLSNVGIECILLDIVPSELSEEEKKKGIGKDSREFRDRIARTGLERALKSKPASFYLPENAKLIHIGNIEDDLDLLRDTDWIIEVVPEILNIKSSLYEKIEGILREGIIISSNTSGIPAKALCEGRSELFRRHFAITHFFNPPRYMKLIELVPGPDTLPEVMETLEYVCERILGKGVVYAKDTPNFIANRIGTFSMFAILKNMMELGLSIEAVDQLTGKVVGNPKSATFRTADLVGIDTLLHVAENVYEGAQGDEKRDMFIPPPFLKEMVKKGLLGEKTGKGFYKKIKGKDGKSVILSMDYNTLEYRERQKVNFPSLERAKGLDRLEERIKTLFWADDLAGRFTSKTMSETLIYCANRLREIADDIVNIDNAIRWGFARRLGPFEIWDAIGVKRSVEKMKSEGFSVPTWVEEMLSVGFESFYRWDKGVRLFYDPNIKDYRVLEIKPGIILLPSLKAQNRLVEGNRAASLVDIGDGIACLEFHTKMNAIGDEMITMINRAMDIVAERFDGLLIANHGEHFSAGANLYMILFAAQEEEWDELEWAVKRFQDTLMRLKYFEKPVVAAPAGLTLGGGCEICLASDRVRYCGETYMGLVEAGVGLIPAGGGTKELYLRNTEHLFEVQKGGLYPKQIELMPFVARAFETIAMAKVSTSGPEAVKLGYLRPTDKMTVNRDYLIEDGEKTLLSMLMEGYTPPRPKEEIRVAGENTFAMIKLALWTMHKSGFITEHDVTVSEKIGYVLCGGRVFSDTKVSEQYLLDLEREAFLSLCGDPKTQARIEHMLKTGKPLRN
ncbi:MAG TPA: 3-hydroxyacyl-CoA dehydrogenase/enoyl-CoA hydratase family protein [Desulfobacteraceae bacterium]|nr:3-hydroxyacyl-CoA dehydrogenase/enoyl-CoA hydratase family protein [Desulfobacteraceae bacterium]